MTAKQQTAISKVMALLQEWDKGSKTTRKKILEDFIAQNQNKTGPELEEAFAQAASLFLTRLTAWLRLTYPLNFAVWIKFDSPFKWALNLENSLTVRLTSLRHFLLGVLFWMKLFCSDWPSYQKLFVFSVSLFCSEKFTLKLNLWQNIGLTRDCLAVKIITFLQC